MPKLFGLLVVLGLFFWTTVTETKLVSYTLTVEKVPANPDRYPVSAVKVSQENGFQERPFPGPTIRATLGDTIEITLHNHFESAATSLHFHGIHMTNNPWMDGAAGITQAPIPPMTSFTYRFNVTQTGTFWYHSHTSHQYAEGLLGPMILDYPSEIPDPVKEAFYYTHEHIILLQDWFHENLEELHLHYKGPYDAFSKTQYAYKPGYPWKAHSLLMNGRGDYDCGKMNETRTCFIKDTCVGGEQCIRERKPLIQDCRSEPYPIQQFQCSGVYVRLRLINGANGAPFKFWIDKHDLIIVARDGIETKPLTRPYVILAVGQRIDVIVACSRMSPPKKYKMFATTAIGYLPPGADTPKIMEFVSGWLSYPRSDTTVVPDFLPHEDPTREVSHNEAFEQELHPLVDRMAPAADKRIVLQYGEVYSVMSGEPLEEWVINNITHVMPKVPILQAVYMGQNIEDTIAYKGTGPMRNERKTHVIRLEYGKTYEFVIVGLNSQQHPWHLHGYTMDILRCEQMNRTEDFDFLPVKDECGFPRARSIKQKVLNGLPSFKKPAKIVSRGDSFTVPRWGYSVFRVTMDNQGPWLFHCHVGWHLGMGMSVIFSVEKNGTYPDIQDPPSDFPAYLPLSQFRRH